MEHRARSISSELGEFLRDIAGHWFGLMSGVVGVLLWAFGAWVEPVSLSLRLTFLILSAPIMALACFVGWRKRMPKMTGGIDQVVFGVPSNDLGSTMLFLTMNIRNTGQPSIADKWIISACFADGRRVIGQKQFIRNASLAGAPGISVRNYGEEDALYAKGLNPVPTGGMIRGTLMAYFSGITQEQLAKNGTKIFVEFEDVFGRRHSCSSIVQGDAIPIGLAEHFPMKPA